MWSARKFWCLLRDCLGAGKGATSACVDSPAALADFLHSRASLVAQTSLYGYMKTRCGTRYPELFTDAGMLTSINIAKWHVYLACLSDLTVYSGVLLHLHTDESVEQIRSVLTQVFAQVMAEVGTPKEAGAEFPSAVQKVGVRIAHCRLAILQDGDSAFTESPQALVYWSPVADELKNRDQEIIRNSIRFRWQEVRRNLRKQLRAATLVALT